MASSWILSYRAAGANGASRPGFAAVAAVAAAARPPPLADAAARWESADVDLPGASPAGVVWERERTQRKASNAMPVSKMNFFIGRRGWCCR